MPDSKLETDKDALIQRMTEAYARGVMDMAAFERAVTRISACSDPAALESEAGALGFSSQAAVSVAPVLSAELARPSEGIELTCVSGTIRKSGDWLRSRSYALRLKSSGARLDLRHYEGMKGLRLHIDLDAASSSVTLVVPEGFEVEDRLTERVSSAVRNKPKGGSFGDNLIVLTGRLRSSAVRIRYR